MAKRGFGWPSFRRNFSAGGYNPFLLRNTYDYIPVYSNIAEVAWLERAMLRRGMVFVDGKPLKQVLYFRRLRDSDGAFWADEDGRHLHFRLPRDSNAERLQAEVTVREQCFVPRQWGLGFLRVSAFIFEKAADCLPVPQRAILSTMRGHHWIIENNRVEWANACGVDIGCQTWDAKVPEVIGHHIVRKNAIRHCGVCGLAGALGVHHTLIEENTLEHIGHNDLERMWEVGAIKFHLVENSLMRRNVIRHCWRAGGLWMDCRSINNRITGNIFAGYRTRTGAVYSEMNFGINQIDHNIFWDIRSADAASNLPATVGAAIRADCNEKLVVAAQFLRQSADVRHQFQHGAGGAKTRGATGLCPRQRRREQCVLSMPAPRPSRPARREPLRWQPLPRRR